MKELKLEVGKSYKLIDAYVSSRMTRDGIKNGDTVTLDLVDEIGGYQDSSLVIEQAELRDGKVIPVEDTPQHTNPPHVHADMIKAWADGAEIECKYEFDKHWHTTENPPMWDADCSYRIKPEITKEDLIVENEKLRSENNKLQIDMIKLMDKSKEDHIKASKLDDALIEIERLTMKIIIQSACKMISVEHNYVPFQDESNLKKDLKDGMLVTYINGKKRVVSGESFMDGHITAAFVVDYDSNLSHRRCPPMKIESINSSAGELLYKRK